MNDLRIETERLIITHFDESMIESVHRNSLDKDVREFVPDEVFETINEAESTVRFLIQCYEGNTGPFVYPILLKSNENIGYVQAVPLENGEWEVGYHIAQSHTRNGYATEALLAFIPVILERLSVPNIWGVCRSDNKASLRVLEKCSFILQEKNAMNYHGAKHEVCKYLYSVM